MGLGKVWFISFLFSSCCLCKNVSYAVFLKLVKKFYGMGCNGIAIKMGRDCCVVLVDMCLILPQQICSDLLILSLSC